MLRRACAPASAAFAVACAFGSVALAQDYRIERIASGLNQPTYVTQAPGDPANILYFTERTSNTIGGFGPVNDMCKVWRYDVEAVKRGNEDEVEGEEPQYRAQHRRPESTAQCQEKGQQEIEEEHVEDAELRAEYEHDSCQRGHGAKGDGEPVD